MDIREKLLEAADLRYRDFQRRLMPTVQPETVMGVRTPTLRKFARELAGTTEAEEFMAVLPHDYYEENNLHAFLIEAITDYDAAVEAVERFLPYVNNWATCDSMSPKVFGKHTDDLTQKIKAWLKSNHTYTIRFGIEMLMRYYSDDLFDTAYPTLVAEIKSDEYYVNMMRAWYFATVLAKQYDAIMPFLENNRLDEWTHNKTIQKAIESYRIPHEQKVKLRTLKSRKKF